MVLRVCPSAVGCSGGSNILEREGRFVLLDFEGKT
jgi:hypothetical protein